MIVDGLKVTIDPEIEERLRRVDILGRVEIHELTPHRHDDFMSFFDHDAFLDNPAWAGCYCLHPHFGGEERDWAYRSGADNRRDMSELIRAGRAGGLLAYVDGRPAGWCNAGPRLGRARLQRQAGLEVDDAERVGSIVCFNIASRYRRHGVGRRLLEAACGLLADQGFAIAEGYPARDPRSDAAAFKLPLRMYLDADFEP